MQNHALRSDERAVLDESSVGLLKRLHLLTRDGKLNADARRKLKQVNHLVNLLRPALDDLFERTDDPCVVDVGAGKAYLGFILYELFLRNRPQGRIVSIETRPELVQQGRDMALEMGFARMAFTESAIANTALPSPTHLLTALHACDTATDDALLAGLRAETPYIAVVPCCQAEVAQLLRGVVVPGSAELWRHGIHRREFASHLTNVVRALVLESQGYSVTVTELVGWEHSLKNELILARKVQRSNPQALRRLQALLATVPVRPKIVRELELA